MKEMKTLSEDDVSKISGGHPFWVGVGAAAGYMAIIDYAMDFGRGLGNGLYDAFHS